MAKDVLAGLVGLLADIGHEIATMLGDPTARDGAAGQRGHARPAGAPPASAGRRGDLLEALHTGARRAQSSEARLARAARRARARR